ncbi:MAG: ABC transporter permease [Cyclobacteriaceae bacterium]
MFKSNLKIASRNLKRQPFFTLLNTFGLAIGMAGALLISLFVYDELSFNQQFADADRIYRININSKTAGEENNTAAVSGPLAAVMVEDCPQVELVTRFRRTQAKLMRKPADKLNTKEEFAVGVDGSFFDMFGLELLEGDSKTALQAPMSVVLTESAAEKHFGEHEALGQSLLIDNGDLYVVTGIMADMPRNSLLRDYSVFLSIDSFEDASSPAWNNWNFPTFVKLIPAADHQDFNRYLSNVTERYLIPWAMTFVPGLTVESSRESNAKTGNYMIFNSTALTDIHLYSHNRSGEFNANGDIQNVYILAIIGIFLVLLASVNFMNLSTARSLRRAKEVGIRKALGSSRLALIRQFLTEAGLVAFLSLIMAIILASVVVPFFNQLSGKAISIPFEEPLFWLLIVVSTVLLGVISGSYPAFVLSKFAAVKVLKGNAGVAGSRIRNFLVVSQFTISVFLIASTLIIFQQLSYIQNKDIGFQKDQILVVEDTQVLGQQATTLKEQISQLSQVERVSLSSYLPTPSDRGGTTFFTEGAFESKNAVIIENWGVDANYVSTLGLEIIAGRDFDHHLASDSGSVILNESAVRLFGIRPEEALGLRITEDFHRHDKENMEYLTIIGITKDFHFESMRSGIDGLSLTLDGNAKKMMVKLHPGDLQGSISQIKKMWEEMTQNQPFSYYFMDDSFNQTYKAEMRLGNIFVTFTTLSILIACLGLFGLAAFNAEKRIKEIGIRKVLGATVNQVTYQLSIDFLKLVIIAIVIALPVSWYVMNGWLEEFSYRINIPVWTFVLTALIAIGISILTVSYQSIKAAISSPAESLRSE